MKDTDTDFERSVDLRNVKSGHFGEKNIEEKENEKESRENNVSIKSGSKSH